MAAVAVAPPSAAARPPRTHTAEEEALLVLYKKLGVNSANAKLTRAPSTPSVAVGGGGGGGAGAGAGSAPLVLSAKQAADKLQAIKAQSGLTAETSGSFKRPTLTLKRTSMGEESLNKKAREGAAYDPAQARDQFMKGFVRPGQQPRSDRTMYTVFVGGLNDPVALYQLRDHFSSCGSVSTVKLISGKNFGFVNFYEAESIPLALKLNGTMLEGNYLRVSKALPRKPAEPFSASAPTPSSEAPPPADSASTPVSTASAQGDPGPAALD